MMALVNDVGALLVRGLGVLLVVVLASSLLGLMRLPRFADRLHAVSSSSLAGLVFILLAICPSSTADLDPPLRFRLALTGLLLIVTAPLATYVLARAAHDGIEKKAHLRDEPTDAPEGSLPE